ncbi:MAG TPA: protoglobin domain-containing protein [Kofleriaceae bacterium]|nr:protoglobin domain-containing protein [Kofleriaceae bacterium]
MTQINYMNRLRLDERELASRRAFFEITDEDLARLATLRAFGERHSTAIVDALYDLILGHPESRTFFTDERAVARVKKMQQQYFIGLFGGRLDLAYVEDRLRVGAAHERIGLAPKWYIGAYSRYLRLLHDRMFAEMSPADASAAFLSIKKLVAFDMALAIDTYNAANMDTVARHQAAIRELSTPVIRVHHRVLLLPLVGTVDSHRAEQIMETLLLKVVDEQARAVIVDIAGVAVVDTQVADHLLKTTEAVRLLGAETILTGISAQIARTIVQLGVDISTMHTRARLADGIELALGIVGRVIVAKEA